MGKEKYCDNIIINTPKRGQCQIVKSILKRQIYSTQYESLEKGIIMAKIVSAWFAGAAMGQLTYDLAN